MQYDEPNTNATLAMNMTGLADYGISYPFIDIMEIASTFHASSRWSDPIKVSMNRRQLAAAGHLDKDGWPKSLPDNAEKIECMWRFTAGHAVEAYRLAGVYHMRYEGEATFNLNGAKILSREPGHVVFSIPATKLLALQITEINPENNIRNIQIVHESNLDAFYNNGKIFDPHWFEKVKGLRTIRFMDWMKTNNSPFTEFDELPEGDDASHEAVPLEFMVRLANETGASPWFCIPWNASDDYCRQFARYLIQHLNPELEVKIEFSNENWNGSFRHNWWIADLAEQEWGKKYRIEYTSKLATLDALIFIDEFKKAGRRNKLVCVLGTQTSNAWVAGQMLDNPVWKEKEPDTFVSPASVFDALAVTTYWGGAMTTDEPLRMELLAVLDDPTQDAIAWVTAKQLDPTYKHSVPHSERMIAANAAVADKHGLRLLAYEGGQHMHHSFGVKSMTPEQSARLTAFMGEYVRSAGMAKLYQASWDVWKKYGDGPYMQFADITANSKWGMWGLWEHTRDSSPRSELLENLNATTEPWWETDPGPVPVEPAPVELGIGFRPITDAADRAARIEAMEAALASAPKVRMNHSARTRQILADVHTRLGINLGGVDPIVLEAERGMLELKLLE